MPFVTVSFEPCARILRSRSRTRDPSIGWIERSWRTVCGATCNATATILSCGATLLISTIRCMVPNSPSVCPTLKSRACSSPRISKWRNCSVPIITIWCPGERETETISLEYLRRSMLAVAD
uniref:Uncharacterized protein n=1 Tax=Cacopsylla melanoneura TaxID=428564 RepID=A0A8D8U6I4_9HEMI